MELNYRRCPEDPAKVLSATIGTSTGQKIELSLSEIVTALSLKGSIYTVTLAIKNGVGDDFISRSATALAAQMDEDVHALCPVIGILLECFALMNGGTSWSNPEGRIHVSPSKPCPPWLRGYFDKLMEE